MADQTERSPKSNSYPSNNPISGLRTQIAAGQPIDAVDINGLIDLINEWIGHTHTYNDAYQLATYGNNGDRTDYYEDKETGNTALSTIGQVSAGSMISSDKHNEMRNRCNSLRGHDHTINDRTS
jgi:SOS-response transcriptional repressor LexA